jgi:hypothetical protein
MSGSESMIAPGLVAAGTALSAGGQIQSGNAAASQGLAQQQQKDLEAQQQQQQAGQVRAFASHQAEVTARNTGLVLSAGRSNAAWSGTTTTNPGVVNTLGQVAGQGEYNALAQLATGEENARGLDTRAALSRYEGQQAAQAGQIRQQSSRTQAISTIFSGAGSLFTKYGFGGPSTANQSGANAAYAQAFPGFDFSQAG